MKCFTLIMTAIFAVFAFCGCASLVYDTEVETVQDVKKTDEESDEADGNAIDIEAENNAARTAFVKALENMLENRVFPDGSAFETFNEDDSLENNEFAVYDVDSDGKDELVIRFTDTFMAGMVEMVFGYDSKTDSLIKKLAQFPAVNYYDNGTLYAVISHNQGKAGDFWPYTAYKYNKDKDIYESIMFVDAWDGKYFEEEFPEAADADGDKMVFFLNPDYDSGYYANPVDNDVYEAWKSEFFNDSKAIELPFVNLTEENIDLCMDGSKN